MIKKRRRRKKRYHTGVHSSSKCVIAKYRSGWELQYMQWLDNNTDVLSYQYEAIKIPYISNVRIKRVRNYIPDFMVTYVDGHVEIVEVKPARKMLMDQVVKKANAAAEWCLENNMKYVIVTEVELKQLTIPICQSS